VGLAIVISKPWRALLGLGLGVMDNEYLPVLPVIGHKSRLQRDITSIETRDGKVQQLRDAELQTI